MIGNRFQRYIRSILFTIVCLLTRSGHATTRNCSSAHGTIVIGQRLEDYTFRTLDMIGKTQCAHECFTRPSCMSFNYHTIMMTCELNTNSSDTGQMGSLSQYAGYSYSDIDTWTGFSGSCTRSTCSEGQKCFQFTSTISCIYTECMERPLLGVNDSMGIGVVGQSFPVTCKTGYEARGDGANVTCMGNGLWEVSSSYCHRMYSSDWMLLARFRSGNGESVVSTWSKTGRDDNRNASMPDECKETNASSVCTSHFRSGLIDDWTTLNPTEIIFSLYNAGVEVVNITFNATETNSMSWFAKERLLSTSYTDLQRHSTTNFFSVVDYGANRRFYIHESFGGCYNDPGWVQIIDTDAKGVCFYDDAAAFPKFLYSRNNVAGLVGIDSLVADVLAIFVKM